MDRQTLLIQLGVRLLLGAIYVVALIVTGAPPWAFVLALIAATYWGPPTRTVKRTRNDETLDAILRTLRR